VSLPESDVLDPTIEAEVVDDQPADEEPFEKPKAGVYTMLLIVSFFALLTGIVCLHGEMKIYDFEFNPRKVTNDAENIKSPSVGDQSSWHQPTANDKAQV